MRWREGWARALLSMGITMSVTARAEDGLEVQGVGAGWGIGLDGRPWWPGEADRWLGNPPAGWSHL